MARHKVFISWAGERSKVVASTLCDCLPLIVPAVEPFFSPEIEKGTKSFEAIQAALQEDCGIFCLTPENIESKWLHFEAGAIFKGRDNSRLWTLLLCNLKPVEVKKPLDFPQHTFPTKEDGWRMIVSINKACGDDAIDEKRLEQFFAAFWGRIQSAFVKAEQMALDSIPEARGLDDKMDEVVLGLREIREELLPAILVQQIPSEVQDSLRKVHDELILLSKFLMNKDDNAISHMERANLQGILGRMIRLKDGNPNVIYLSTYKDAQDEIAKLMSFLISPSKKNI